MLIRSGGSKKSAKARRPEQHRSAGWAPPESYPPDMAASGGAAEILDLEATSVRFLAFSFFMMLRTCTLTVLSPMFSS
jgi:hypothetical protein